MKEVKNVNGYRMLFLPDHPKSYTSSGYEGFYYEHIYIMENELGRYLTNEECVHHLDGDKENNRISNLIVLTRGHHTRLHMWLDNQTTKMVEKRFCKVCDATLQYQQKKFCSPQCCYKGRRKVKRPTKEQLLKDLETNSFVAVGKKYGVSDNAIRKWLK